MKYILKFYEVADSDHSYISLEVDGVVVGRNYDPIEVPPPITKITTHHPFVTREGFIQQATETTEGGTMWLNQTLEGEATKEELESLKRILKLN